MEKKIAEVANLKLLIANLNKQKEEFLRESRKNMSDNS